MEHLLKRLRKAQDELYIHRRTRHTIRVSSDRLEAILGAWNDAGPMPAYHEHMKNKLRRDWPTLTDALDKASERASE